MKILIDFIDSFTVCQSVEMNKHETTNLFQCSIPTTVLKSCLAVHVTLSLTQSNWRGTQAGWEPALHLLEIASHRIRVKFLPAHGEGKS